jgi:hypothetical protein
MQENVIIEFSADVSKLTPALEILEKLGQMSASDVKAAKAAMGEYKAQQDAVAAGTRVATSDIDKLTQTISGMTSKIANGAIGSTFKDVVAAMQKVNPASVQMLSAVANIGDAGEVLEITLGDSYRAVQDIQGKIAAIEEENKELAESMDGSRASLEQNSDAIHENNMQLEILQQKLNEEEKHLQASAQAVAFSSGSYKQMQAALEILQDEYENLSQSEREEGDTGKSMLLQIRVLKDAIKQMNEELSDKSPEARLKGLKDELTNMVVAGQSGSKAYMELTEEIEKLAGQIEEAKLTVDVLASDTKAIDAFMEFGEGAAGAFESITAGAALVGGDMEELQEAFYKVQAALSVLNGAQAAFQAFGKKGILIENIRLMQAKMMTPALNAQTGATVKLTVVQKVFNWVASLNPYVLLATGVLALIGAIVWLIATEDKSTKAQIKNNEATKLQLEQQKRRIEGIKDETSEQEHAIEHEIEMMKIHGESADRIAKKERELAAERVKNAKEIQEALTKENGSLEKNRKRVKELQSALDDLDKAKNKGKKKTTITIGGEVKKVEVNDEKVRESIQGALDNFTAKVDVQVEADDNAQKSNEEQNKLLAQQKQDAIARAKERAKEELAIIRQSDDVKLKLIKDEGKRRTAEISLNYSRQKKDLEKRLKEDKLLTEKAQNEIKTMLKNLETQKQGELDALAADLAKKRLDATREAEDIRLSLMSEGFDKQRTLTEIEYGRQIEDLKTRLATEKGLTEEQQNLINQNIINLEKKKAKEIAAIDTAETFELLKEIERVEMDALENRYNQEQIKLSEMRAQGLIKEEDYQKKKEQLQRKYATDSIQIQIDGINRQLMDVDAGSNEEKELFKQSADAKKRLAKEVADAEIAEADRSVEKRKEKEQQLQEALSELKSQAFQLAQDLVASAYDSQKAALDKELSDLDKYYTTDAEAAKKNKNLKLISEEELARRQSAIKNKQAKVEKEQKVVSATMAAFAGAAQALPNFILAGIVLAFGLAQVAMIASQKVPQYAKGRKGGRGEYALTGEFGPEVMWVPNGASIIPAHKSKKLIEGMKIAGEYKVPFPRVPSFSNIDVAGLKNGQYIDIDYEKFGRAVAKNMPGSPDIQQLNVNMDENGFSKFLTSKTGRTVFLNSRS